MIKKRIVFIKLGGSLITDKRRPFFLRENILERVIREIKRASDSGKCLVVGHGNGSFGHVIASKFQTQKGIVNKDSQRGICESG